MSSQSESQKNQLNLPEFPTIEKEHQHTPHPFSSTPQNELNNQETKQHDNGEFIYEVPLDLNEQKEIEEEMKEEQEVKEINDLINKMKLTENKRETEIETLVEYTGLTSFKTLDDAVFAVNHWADKNNIVIRKGSGNNKLTKTGEKRKVVLVCQFSGKRKSKVPEGKKRVIKTECPFRINLNYKVKTDTWQITKMNLKHNHPLILQNSKSEKSSQNDIKMEIETMDMKESNDIKENSKEKENVKEMIKTERKIERQSQQHQNDNSSKKPRSAFRKKISD